RGGLRSSEYCLKCDFLGVPELAGRQPVPLRDLGDRFPPNYLENRAGKTRFGHTCAKVVNPLGLFRNRHDARLGKGGHARTHEGHMASITRPFSLLRPALPRTICANGRTKHRPALPWQRTDHLAIL